MDAEHRQIMQMFNDSTEEEEEEDSFNPFYSGPSDGENDTETVIQEEEFSYVRVPDASDSTPENNKYLKKKLELEKNIVASQNLENRLQQYIEHNNTEEKSAIEWIKLLGWDGFPSVFHATKTILYRFVAKGIFKKIKKDDDKVYLKYIN
jgi:hypothetical protein